MDDIRFKDIQSRVYSGRLQPPHVMLDDLETLIEMVNQLKGTPSEHSAEQHIERIKQSIRELNLEREDA